MGHDHDAHTWGPIYDFGGSSYRECAEPGCNRHQQWICQLDRWSVTFDTPSPRQRAQEPTPVDERPVRPARVGRS